MLKKVLSFISLCSCLNAAQPQIIEDAAKLPILTPAFAERHILKLQLENGLEAYLISDPNVDKSSAAMVVKTGSWEDPEDFPGTAHFLEHMLFLGTKKYPKESEYSRYISEHGGTYNAFTSSYFTAYLFAIDNNAFPEALDRLSSFFKEPLFNPSGVSRELNAINQEYAKNVENDDIREYYIQKEISNPDHPNHAFSMGNQASLQKVSQDTLKKWYASHYSANRMRLIVISNQPLEKLQNLVTEDFKGIPNSNLPPLTTDLPLLSNETKGHMVYIEPVKNTRKLTLLWELPSHFASMQDSKPEKIVGYVLGHEGKKSLLSNLKKEKLAEAIACGGQIVGGKNFAFYLEVTLTDMGTKNVDEVIMQCFQAIANFQKKGVPSYLYDDLHTMDTINYQYQTREDAFEHIMKEAFWSANESLATYPEQSSIIQRFDPQAVKEFLSYLTPQNCIFDLLAPSSLTGVEYDRKEQWLGAHYTIKEIPESLLQTWENATTNAQIDLPDANPYIPKTLALVAAPITSKPSADSENYIPHPKLLLNDDHGKIYWSPDTLYAMPQISWTFQIKSPSISPADAASMVLADLFVKNATEALSNYTYPASMAGLNFSFTRTDDGLSLSIDGFSDKADLLFLDIIKELKSLHPREQKFKIYKDALLRQYQNASLEMPILQSIEILKSLIYKDYVTDKNKALAIKKITFDKFEEFSSTLFNKAYIEGIIYGNIDEVNASLLASKLLASLDSQPYPKDEQYKKAIITLPEDKGPYFYELTTKAQGNAVILAITTEPFSFKVKAAQQILMQAMKEPFFTELRTKQQTGYIVLSRLEEFELHLFDLFAVQSNTHDGRDLLARFELFIEGFLQELTKAEVTQDRFDNIKKSLLSILQQPPKNVSEMGEVLNRIAFTYNGDFDWISKRIQGFQELTYEEFLESVQQVMGKQNKQRLAILLKGNIPEETALQYKKAANLAQLRKLVTYEEAIDKKNIEISENK